MSTISEPIRPSTATYSTRTRSPSPKPNSLRKHPITYPEPTAVVAPPKYTESDSAPSIISTEPTSYIQTDYTAVAHLDQLKDVSMVVDCPVCAAREMTRIEYVAGGLTHAFAAVAILILCCWLPYVTKSLKTVEHRCGNCQVLLAIWRRRGRTEVVVGGVPLQRYSAI